MSIVVVERRNDVWRKAQVILLIVNLICLAYFIWATNRLRDEIAQAQVMIQNECNGGQRSI